MKLIIKNSSRKRKYQNEEKNLIKKMMNSTLFIVIIILHFLFDNNRTVCTRIFEFYFVQQKQRKKRIKRYKIEGTVTQILSFQHYLTHISVLFHLLLSFLITYSYNSVLCKYFVFISKEIRKKESFYSIQFMFMCVDGTVNQKQRTKFRVDYNYNIFWREKKNGVS